jgi:hypothetical protein
MKAKTRQERKKKVVHKGNEGQNSENKLKKNPSTKKETSTCVHVWFLVAFA